STSLAMMPARGRFASRIERASGQQGATRHRGGVMRKFWKIIELSIRSNKQPSKNFFYETVKPGFFKQPGL
ncbi:MAG: hypothetical protein K9K81_08595, partial [Desulfobacteraceae bacterium]|nr:hypothetical protein [Desulfobacteraceae bacterium]